MYFALAITITRYETTTQHNKMLKYNEITITTKKINKIGSDLINVIECWWCCSLKRMVIGYRRQQSFVSKHNDGPQIHTLFIRVVIAYLRAFYC